MIVCGLHIENSFYKPASRLDCRLSSGDRWELTPELPAGPGPSRQQEPRAWEASLASAGKLSEALHCTPRSSLPGAGTLLTVALPTVPYLT